MIRASKNGSVLGAVALSHGGGPTLNTLNVMGHGSPVSAAVDGGGNLHLPFQLQPRSAGIAPGPARSQFRRARSHSWCECLCYNQEMGRSPQIDTELLRAFRAAICAKIEREIAREQQTAERLRSDVLPGLRCGVQRARDEGLCQGAWLIGSYAWGTPTERSDVDLVVEEARDLTRIASLVGEQVRRHVHVIALAAASEELRRRALSSGVPL